MTSRAQPWPEQTRNYPTIVRTPAYREQGRTTTPGKPSDSSRRRPHTPPVPVLPLEPIIQPPAKISNSQPFHGVPKLTIPSTKNVRTWQNTDHDQLLFTPRVTPQGPPVPREENVEPKSATYHQDQLLEQIDRLRDRQIDYLKSRRQQVEDRVNILLNWRHQHNSLDPLAPLDQDLEYVDPASNFAVHDRQHVILLSGLQVDLQNEIYERSLGRNLLPYDREPNMPIHERFDDLLAKLEELYDTNFQSEKHKVRQMSYEEAIAKREAYAHILRVGERNAIAAPVAMTAVGNFEILAKVEEERRDSQVAQEESELGSDGWYPIR